MVVRYRDLLFRLLPPGRAWPREQGTTLFNFLYALAEELARIDGRALALLEERDPSTTTELITDWERYLGLPGPCVKLSSGLAQRREDVLTRLNSLGGQSRAYFIELAARLGISITIYEYQELDAGSLAGSPLTNDEWVHTWLVFGGQVNIIEFKVGTNGCGDPLRDWASSRLECLFEELKPAHTHIIYSFGDNFFRAGDVAGSPLQTF